MNDTVTVVFPVEWVTLTPQLQHSLFEAAILTNIYDSLTAIGTTGEIIPSLASKWEINDNFTEFVFEIDTSRKFSNGEYISANDFKKSWEEGFRLAPKSSNSSLLDVLYKLEGFEDFEKAGEISGLKVLADNKLMLKFKDPFRRALEELSGSRFSASKKDQNQMIIGTGRYIISEIKDKELMLQPNKHHKDSKKIHPVRLVIDKRTDKLEVMKSYKNVVCEYLYNIDQESFKKANYPLAFLSGQPSTHVVYMLNTSNESPFSDVALRRGFQALMLQKLKTFDWPEDKKGTFLADQQSYLSYQAGVLDPKEVDLIIEKNSKNIEYFTNFNSTKPLRLLMGAQKSLLLDLLKYAKINFIQPYKDISWDNYLKKVYNDLDYDLDIGTFSVAGSDPDSLYHILGKNGAIKSKATYIDSIHNLLEEGRNIFKHNDVHDHYKKVSKEILSEVPYVHIGFTRKITFYNKDEIEVDSQFLKRRDYGFHIYKVK